MIKFIARRLGISFLILLFGSVLVFFLTVYSGDPLQDLRESTSSNRETLIRQRVINMDLNHPWYVRYWDWLRGAAGCLRLQCDLGKNREGMDVTALVMNAAGSTLRLVVLATILAIVIGVFFGIVTAVRQYSGLDYTVTFLAFVFFSLPVFWAAVLLKEYGAIRFNTWLADPQISWQVMVGAGLVTAVAAQAAFAGDLRRRLMTAGISFVIVVAALVYFDTVSWVRQPSVGLPVFLLASISFGLLVIYLTTGLGNKGVRNAVATTVGVGIVSYAVLRGMLLDNPSWLLLLGCFAFGLLVAIVAGLVWGGFSLREAIQASFWTSLGMSMIAFADLMLTNWAAYLSIQSRPIPTIGAETPNLKGDFWTLLIDKGTHILLPTIVLTLISIAAYTRYTRASMLEVLNQDYIRTARSKGLPERKVITKHAFRNSLIPLTTIVAFDFAGLIGGAVLTETVFGWKGMGELFRNGVANVDPGPVMGFFIVTGTAAVVMNMVADIAYAFLDPRITR